MKNNITKVFDKRETTPSISLHFGLLALLLLLIAMYSSNAQTISPMRYWTFNGANAGTDSLGVSNLNFTAYSSQYSVGTNGQVGKYLTLDGADQAAVDVDRAAAHAADDPRLPGDHRAVEHAREDHVRAEVGALHDVNDLEAELADLGA